METTLHIEVTDLQNMIVRIITTIKKMQIKIHSFNEQKLSDISTIEITLSGDQERIEQTIRLLNKLDYINSCRQIQKIIN